MNDDALFEIYLREQLALELATVTKETEKVLKDKVESSIYESYSPQFYDRTDSLKDSITSENNNIEGKVYFDEDKLGHTNAYGDTKLVPQYLDYGWQHEGWSGGIDHYHERLPAHFVEDTVDEIGNKQEFSMFEFKVLNE